MDNVSRRSFRIFCDGLFRTECMLIAVATAMLTSSMASAALREYRVHFDPSPSPSAAGYIMHIGADSADYAVDFDLGSPPAGGGTIIYAMDLEDSVDLFVAMRAYNGVGDVSALSNEIRVEAIIPPPTGGGDTGGGDTGGGDTGGGDTRGGDIGPTPMVAEVKLGVVSDVSGMISTLGIDGGLAAMTMDSLAAAGDLRPTTCDLDGDGDRDMVVGFGKESRGQIAILLIEDGSVISVQSVTAGTPGYRKREGYTTPACGDLDGDGLGEIVVGFGPRMRGAVQIFDDVAAGFAPLTTARSDAEGFMQIPLPRKFYGKLYPAMGDIDGDGLDELVIGMGRTRTGVLVVLDDASTEFAVHPGNQTGDPWLTVDAGISGLKGKNRTFPALGDIDGDGRDEIAVSFGRGSHARVAILDDAVDGFPETPGDLYVLATGRAQYAESDGATRSAFGDFDGDGVEELVIGFRRAGGHEVQAFDDIGNALRPMQTEDGFVQTANSSAHIMPAPTR